ncbi:hypothetical protein B0H13DRAFT_2062511, partial [Mycena leptocephala]
MYCYDCYDITTSRPAISTWLCCATPYFILFHLISLVCYPQLPAHVFISMFLAVRFPSILASIFDSARGGDVVRSAVERSVKQQPALHRIPSYGVLVQPHPSPPAATR